MAGIPPGQPYHDTTHSERPVRTSPYAALAILAGIVIFALAAVAAMSPNTTPGLNGAGLTTSTLNPDLVPFLLTAGLIIIALGLVRPITAALMRDRY